MIMTDISGVIEEGMWSYGGALPPVRIRRLSSPRETSYTFALNSISGTYLETSAHRLPGGPALDDIPPGRLILPASIIQLETKKPRGHITAGELRASGVRIRNGDAVIVATGWDRRWNKPGFVTESPHFTSEAMDWVLGRGPA
ncbi:MAG: cyclase family protein, partial [Lentisphaerae bacterium]|nr:cyclase family protein [Lentisphaerota bacterium]